MVTSGLFKLPPFNTLYASLSPGLIVIVLIKGFKGFSLSAVAKSCGTVTVIVSPPVFFYS